MNINEELNNFDKFLKNLSIDEFDDILEKAGINQIGSAEESNMTYITQEQFNEIKKKEKINKKI